MPGRRFSILYAPFESVATDRTLSMSTSLAASTVTPGSTAPVASLTTPANALCARAVVGHASRHASAHTDSSSLLMLFPPRNPREPRFGPQKNYTEDYLRIHEEFDNRRRLPSRYGNLDPGMR